MAALLISSQKGLEGSGEAGLTSKGLADPYVLPVIRPRVSASGLTWNVLSSSTTSACQEDAPVTNPRIIYS